MTRFLTAVGRSEAQRSDSKKEFSFSPRASVHGCFVADALFNRLNISGTMARAFEARTLKNPNWTREQALACFNLYCRIPFGKFHAGTREIIAFADAIGRTPDAVAMKLSNFASFDPAHKRRNVKGLKNTSSLDKLLWREFEAEPNRIAVESEEAFNRLSLPGAQPVQQKPELPQGPTEKQLTRPMRLVQDFFRRSVLGIYGYKCSFCGLEMRELLNASHIIPWNISEELRADPRNGLCLCVLHDRAFDRGLVTVGADHRLVISANLRKKNPVLLHRVAFIDLEGKKISLPTKFLPAAACLDYHRKERFAG